MGIIFGTTQAGHTVINNLFVGNYSIGLNISTAWTNGFVFYGNTFYGAENQLGVGMNIFTGTTGSWYLNNIFYGFTTGISMPDTPNDMYSDYNDFYNNGTNTLNIDHKPHDLLVNPQFANVHQLVNTGTVTAGASDLTLTDTGQNFSSVVAGSDFIDIISGVNVTTGTYGIVTVAPGADTTKIVLDLDPTPSSTGSSIVYSLTTGRNFATGPNVWRKGSRRCSTTTRQAIWISEPSITGTRHGPTLSERRAHEMVPPMGCGGDHRPSLVLVALTVYTMAKHPMQWDQNTVDIADIKPRLAKVEANLQEVRDVNQAQMTMILRELDGIHKEVKIAREASRADSVHDVAKS